MLALECGAPPKAVAQPEGKRRARSARRLARPKAEQVDNIGINRLAVRLQKLHFMNLLFSQNSKVEQSKIEILDGMSIFAEHVLSLLPTLGRSAILNEPWAPGKILVGV